MHVVRDGRAVVDSLMRVAFWRDTFRYTQPAWAGSLTDEELMLWKEHYDGSPLALAALEWRAVIRHARSEALLYAPEDYGEIRFEDFLAAPHETVDAIFEFANLQKADRPHRFLSERLSISGVSTRWQRVFNGSDLDILDEIMEVEMDGLGYTQTGHDTRSGPALRVPFRKNTSGTPAGDT